MRTPTRIAVLGALLSAGVAAAMLAAVAARPSPAAAPVPASAVVEGADSDSDVRTEKR